MDQYLAMMYMLSFRIDQCDPYAYLFSQFVYLQSGKLGYLVLWKDYPREDAS